MALLKGLSCLVAGGASGLGRATTQRLVQHGCRVVIADLPSSDGDKVANDLGDNCMFVPTDVRVKLSQRASLQGEGGVYASVAGWIRHSLLFLLVGRGKQGG